MEELAGEVANSPGDQAPLDHFLVLLAARREPASLLSANVLESPPTYITSIPSSSPSPDLLANLERSPTALGIPHLLRLARLVDPLRLTAVFLALVPPAVSTSRRAAL